MQPCRGLRGSRLARASCCTGEARTLWYIDLFDILTFVTAVSDGREATDYTKVVTRLTRKILLDEP